jgi:hypothetical protein
MTKQCGLRAEHWLRSDRDDLDEPSERLDVTWISRIQRKIRIERNRRDEKVENARSSRLAPGGRDLRVDTTVCACRTVVERQGCKRGFGALKSILATRSLRSIGGRLWTCGEFGHRDRANERLFGEFSGIDAFEVDHDRSVEDCAPMLSHAVLD